MGAPRRNRSTLAFVLAAIVALGAGGYARHLLAARRLPPKPPARSAFSEPDHVLHVPHAPGAILLDGDTADLGWTGSTGPARTGDFEHATGGLGRRLPPPPPVRGRREHRVAHDRGRRTALARRRLPHRLLQRRHRVRHRG